MARIPSKPSPSTHPQVDIQKKLAAGKNSQSSAESKTPPAPVSADTFTRVPEAGLLSKLVGAEKVLPAELGRLGQAREAAAAAEAGSAAAAHDIEKVEPDPRAARGGDQKSPFPSGADLAGKAAVGGFAFTPPDSMLRMPEPTTPTSSLSNAGPAESRGGGSGPPVPGPRGAMGGADAFHKVGFDKTNIEEGSATRTELRDGTVVEERTGFRDDGTRVRQTDVFYPDGTSMQRIREFDTDDRVTEMERSYDADGQVTDTRVRLPREGAQDPGWDEPTESQKELARWLGQQHNAGKHSPAGSGPRLPTLVNPGDPDYAGAGVGDGPRVQPGEGLVVNPPPDAASPGSRELTPELAAHSREQLEDAIRGPGGPVDDEGGRGGTGGG